MIEAAVLCLALNLYHEARGEPLTGQFAVAQVVLNRAQRDPAKVCEVVQAYRQFSWTLNPPIVADGAPWRMAQEIARLSLSMQDFTGGATHYHALFVSPYWKSDMVILGQWGNHAFYKPKGKR
jgi:spore germination cell wall hydrolase CwlJ-like protein